jgi:hypothetical protein
MSKYDATYVKRGVIERRGNRLDGTVELVEKLVTTRELVMKLEIYLVHQIPRVIINLMCCG